MDQKKIGEFLKELRKEKGLTQEQLSEQFNVTGRTVSRWETGYNMPDLSLIVELADFYDVDIREIFNGERRSEKMESELKETLVKAAEYSTKEKFNLKRRMLIFSTLSYAFLLGYLVLLFLDEVLSGPVYDFASGFMLGFAVGGMALNLAYMAGILDKVSAWKRRVIFRERVDA